jgi:hypothetical protein
VKIGHKDSSPIDLRMNQKAIRKNYKALDNKVATKKQYSAESLENYNLRNIPSAQVFRK